jgi:hypothetical protein
MALTASIRRQRLTHQHPLNSGGGFVLEPP